MKGSDYLKKNIYESGLHFKLPYPIETVIYVESNTIKSISLGNVINDNVFALIWAKTHSTDNSFISGDNNLVYPYFIIHYRIKDIYDYTYSISDDTELISVLLEDIITKEFTHISFYDISTKIRQAFTERIISKLQIKLDELNTGIEIISINLKDIHPPINIAPTFEDVIAAYQDKLKMINQAYAYRNESIPNAIGEKYKLLSTAESYKINKINNA